MAPTSSLPQRRHKVLFIAFKYLGDVVVAIPALRAYRQHYPADELHLLVAEDALPLVATLPWINRVWALPRTRGKVRLRETIPVIRALRAEQFDLSADLIGNDRGAFLSLAVGAPRRYGLHSPRGFLGRRACYHHPVEEAPADWHETRRHMHFLRVFGVGEDAPLDLELRPDPAEADAAARLLPAPAIIAHISTSKPVKEWPLASWCNLTRLAREAGHRVLFAAGPTPRERALLKQLQADLPDAELLPETPSLRLYLAVLARASLLVSGDTGPMHFAAGLGIPTVSLFGPSYVHQWAPRAPLAVCLQAEGCRCDPRQDTCTAATPCLGTLLPDRVWETMRGLLNRAAVTPSP